MSKLIKQVKPQSQTNCIKVIKSTVSGFSEVLKL